MGCPTCGHDTERTNHDPLYSCGTWDISQERSFLESLLCQRFNFLLVLFSLTIAGAASTDSQAMFELILWLGAVVCFLISLTVYRTNFKLSSLMSLIFSLPRHPATITDTAAKAAGLRALFSVRWIIGILVPTFCCLTLVILAILAQSGLLKAA